MITDSSNVVGAPGIAGAQHSWTPLAAADTCAEARAAVADIARAAPSHIPRRVDGTLDVSFGAGAAGVAVFLHYAARALDDADAHAACIDLLGQALDGLHSLSVAGLFPGYTGVAWAISHLQQRGVDELSDVDLAEVDVVVEALLRRIPWPDDYDLIAGLVGIGVYGLERMNQNAGEGIVAAVVSRLAEMVEWMGDGLAAWFHPPWLVPPLHREAAPDGWYNLGVAHGIPGVLAFLARAARCDVRLVRALRLLDAGARWTRAQVQVHGTEGVRIGCRIDPRAPRAASPSRDAWCYGAPGAAVALLAAARALGDESLAASALVLARTAARHEFMETGVVDPSFCHGSSGLAHLFARLHAVTGELEFADAARRWTARTLAFRRPGEGVGGFSYLTARADQPVWIAGSNFLEGASGIGLVLLAMSSSEPPAWDRVVLADPALSVPHHGGTPAGDVRVDWNAVGALPSHTAVR